MAGQIARLIEIDALLLVQPINRRASDIKLDHPGVAGLHDQFRAILLRSKSDRGCLDPHRQILGYQHNIAALGREITRHREDASVVVAQLESARKDRRIRVVQLHAQSAT